VLHAHTKGIIHRDLKPSNVLVALYDGKPVPKVIDFGIAKAINQRLTEKTVFTEMHQLIGTPEYMSPEQAEMSGLDIDTRSDIYSLGVLLYELLTGTTPFDPKELREAGYGEIQRIIREVEPPKPSTRLSTMGEKLATIAKHRSEEPSGLRKTMSGDLDWIAMKSLEKDRTRRYETADALALDVLRYLCDEPVSASPPNWHYRASKFVRRNRNLVASFSTILMLILLGGIGLGWLALAESRAKIEANRQRDASLIAQANSLLILSDMIIRHEPIYKGREFDVKPVLQECLKIYEQTHRHNEPPAAWALVRLAQVLRREQKYDQAINLYRQAIQRLEALGRDRARDPIFGNVSGVAAFTGFMEEWAASDWTADDLLRESRTELEAALAERLAVESTEPATRSP
jgi:serine/threonine protein kinase